MVANQHKLVDAAASVAVSAENAHEVGLEDLACLIDNRHIEVLHLEEEGAGRKGARRSHDEGGLVDDRLDSRQGRPRRQSLAQ